MLLLYLSLGITVVFNLLYHIFQKSISPSVHPLVSVIITYVVALGISVLLLMFFPIKTSFIQEVRNANWATYALAIGLVGIEVGFLLMYRYGWNLGIGSISSNALVTLMLIPIGILLFKESFTLIRLLGVVLAVTGLVLMNLKK